MKNDGKFITMANLLIHLSWQSTWIEDLSIGKIFWVCKPQWLPDGLDHHSMHSTWSFVYQPPEKVNCILNLGLNTMGCMSSAVHCDPAFEKRPSNCQGVNDVRNLIEKNPYQKAKLLKESSSNCLDLIKAIFLVSWIKGK